MKLPAEIQSAVDAENRHRSLAWLALAPDLCGSPIVHLTARMRHELELAGNAFFSGRAPLLKDVFDLLWRLNPNFIRPARPRFLRKKNLLLLRRWQAFGSLRHARIFRALEKRVSMIDLTAAGNEIRVYLSIVHQDRPAGSPVVHSGIVPKPRPYWLDDLVHYFGTEYGRSDAEILDAPLARLYQLWRASAIANGTEVIDSSTAAAADYVRNAMARRRAPVNPAVN